jgi:hypothetical protein
MRQLLLQAAVESVAVVVAEAALVELVAQVEMAVWEVQGRSLFSGWNRWKNILL